MNFTLKIYFKWRKSNVIANQYQLALRVMRRKNPDTDLVINWIFDIQKINPLICRECLPWGPKIVDNIIKGFALKKRIIEKIYNKLNISQYWIWPSMRTKGGSIVSSLSKTKTNVSMQRKHKWNQSRRWVEVE